MNIFKRELKANLRPLIIWCVCMILVVVSGMGKFTAYTGSAANMDIFNDIPQSIRALIGFGSLDVTTINGFFGVLLIYYQLILAIHAVLIGSGIISKEERDKTTEFLIVKPVTRGTIITAKYLAALINIIAVNFVTTVTSVGMIYKSNKGEDITGIIIVSMLSLFVLQLIFLTLGAALASATKHPKASGAMAAGILMGAFIIAKITDLIESLNFLNVLTPFKYFDVGKLVEGKGMDVLPLVLSILLTAFFCATTYVLYKRRDIGI